MKSEKIQTRRFNPLVYQTQPIGEAASNINKKQTIKLKKENIMVSAKEFFDSIKDGKSFLVKCPDGRQREVWGYNETTGDVFVEGWKGNAWIDCANRHHTKVEFEK